MLLHSLVKSLYTSLKTNRSWIMFFFGMKSTTVLQSSFLSLTSSVPRPSVGGTRIFPYYNVLYISQAFWAPIEYNKELFCTLSSSLSTFVVIWNSSKSASQSSNSINQTVPLFFYTSDTMFVFVINRLQQITVDVKVLKRNTMMT